MRDRLIAPIGGLLLVGMLAVPITLRAQVPDGFPPDTAFSAPPISAGGAFFRSLVLPGWAQAELGSPGRGAFYFMMEATSLVMWFRTQGRLDHARRTRPEDSPVIEARRQQREDWIALAVFWSLFSAADGWVSVHLYGFEERTGERPPEVSLEIWPEPSLREGSAAPAMNLGVKLSL